MKKILVTGANGQLGLKIRQLLSADYQLILTDTDTMDITNKLQVHKVIKLEKPDVIIHGAAYTAVDKAEENEELCRMINAEGTKNIAEAAKENDTTVIYISTDYVFDGKKRSPYVETDATNPLSVYGQTKYEGELEIEKCEKYYIVRTAWVFGELPKDYAGANFVETMLRLAKEKPELNIVNDQVGSPTYTKDLVLAIKELIEKAAPFGLYHFSGEGECTWFDFAKEILEQSNLTTPVNPITSDQYPQKAKRPSYTYLSKEKIKQLNILVRPWQEMLKEYLDNK